MITGTSSATGVSVAGTQIAQTNQMGQDTFLKLLVTQLRNQDPLKPMEDKEFIAQMAQFSSLEQMQNMNKNLQAFTKGFLDSESGYRAVSLIGRTITAIDPADPKKTVTGKVDYVQFDGGIALLRVGGKDGKDIPVANVMKVE